MVKEPRITLKPELHTELLRIQKRSTFGSVSALVQYILTRYVENYGDTSIYGSYIPHKDKPDEGDLNDEKKPERHKRQRKQALKKIDPCSDLTHGNGKDRTS